MLNHFYMERYGRPLLTAKARLEWLVPGLYAMLAVIGLQGYLGFGSLNFILGLAALPFVLPTTTPGRTSKRYAWIAVVFIALNFLLPVRTIFYLSLCFAFLFFMESRYGRTHFLTACTLVMMSPAFEYLVNTFSFPIRLELSRLAGQLLEVMGVQVSVAGNVITYNDLAFSVDPGCMGLSMMQASLLLGIMAAGFYIQRLKRKPRTATLLFYLVLIVLLNLAANLFRILLLVLFGSMPGTLLHECIGIASLTAYVIIPAMLIARFLVGRATPFSTEQAAGAPAGFKPVLHLLLCAALIVLTFHIGTAQTHPVTPWPQGKTHHGFQVDSPTPGILKLRSADALIYIKYSRGFYDTDHNPMLCWTGSGYTMQRVQRQTIAGRLLYSGIMARGDERLYTAWWYDNGASATIDPLRWRWDMLSGAGNYAVVNITCADQVTLAKEVSTAVQQQTLLPFITVKKAGK